LGNNVTGNTEVYYSGNVVPYIVGNAPVISNVVPGPGFGNLTVSFKKSDNANPAPYYHYNINGNVTFANSGFNCFDCPGMF
jgi:hypothetical protein